MYDLQTIVHLLYDCTEVYNAYKSIWFANPVSDGRTNCTYLISLFNTSVCHHQCFNNVVQQSLLPQQCHVMWPSEMLRNTLLVIVMLSTLISWLKFCSLISGESKYSKFYHATGVLWYLYRAW